MSNKTISYAEIEESRLRDHFAGLIIISLVINKEYKNSVGEINSKAMAEKSYEIADAMLKARKEVNNG